MQRMINDYVLYWVDFSWEAPGMGKKKYGFESLYSNAQEDKAVYKRF